MISSIKSWNLVEFFVFVSQLASPKPTLGLAAYTSHMRHGNYMWWKKRVGIGYWPLFGSKDGRFKITKEINKKGSSYHIILRRIFIT